MHKNKLIKTILIFSISLTIFAAFKIAKKNKNVLDYTENSITLPKDTKRVQDVQYLGENIYSFNIGADSYSFNENNKKEKSKYILVNAKERNLVTKNTFSYVKNIYIPHTVSFSTNKYIPVKYNSKYRLINKKGKFVSKPYDYIDYMGGGVYAVKKNKKMGYINSKMENITKFSDVSLNYSYDFNFLPYKDENNKYGFVDSKGKVLFPCKLDKITIIDDNENLVPVCKDNKWGVIDKKGNKIKDFIFDDIGTFHEGLTRIKQNGKWGYMDDSGNIKIPCKFDFSQDFLKGFAKVSLNSKEGIIDKNGNFIIPPKYSNIYDFIDGLALVESKDVGLGIINTKGEYVIKPDKNLNYLYLDDKNIILSYYINNTQIVKLADRKGNILSNEKIEAIHAFNNNLAFVSRGNKFGFINRKGQIVIPIEFDTKDKFMYFIDNLCIVCKDGKYGLIDIKGNYKIPIKYDKIKPIAKNHYGVKFKGKWGIINSEGKLVKPIEYDEALKVRSLENTNSRVFLKQGNKGLFLKIKK